MEYGIKGNETTEVTDYVREDFIIGMKLYFHLRCMALNDR